MSYGMFLAGSHKCKNHFLSASVDVVSWPASPFSCVVFYKGWFVDFVVGHRDCATHRTVTMFDVGQCYPITTSRYFTQPCWVCCVLQLFWEEFCFYNQMNFHKFILAFQEVLPLCFLGFVWLFRAVHFITTITTKVKHKWTACLMCCLNICNLFNLSGCYTYLWVKLAHTGPPSTTNKINDTIQTITDQNKQLQGWKPCCALKALKCQTCNSCSCES